MLHTPRDFFSAVYYNIKGTIERWVRDWTRVVIGEHVYVTLTRGELFPDTNLMFMNDILSVRRNYSFLEENKNKMDQ